jgi:hypothetical protein
VLSRFQLEDFTVVRKISLALVLISLAGAASARGDGGCPPNSHPEQFLWFTFCVPNNAGPAVRAPEIDPASAMAGLTMLAGGLAVLRGRRRVKS